MLRKNEVLSFVNGLCNAEKLVGAKGWCSMCCIDKVCDLFIGKQLEREFTGGPVFLIVRSTPDCGRERECNCSLT